MGMAAILFNVQNHLNKLMIWTHVKSGENWSSCFREDFERLHNSIHVYSPGARADNPRGTKLIVIKRFYYSDNTALVSAISLFFNISPIQMYGKANLTVQQKRSKVNLPSSFE